MSTSWPSAVDRYRAAAKQDWQYTESCSKCGKSFRTYGSGLTICGSCTPSKQWVPPGSNQRDYGGW
jgi:hypothetical protein